MEEERFFAGKAAPIPLSCRRVLALHLLQRLRDLGPRFVLSSTTASSGARPGPKSLLEEAEGIGDVWLPELLKSLGSPG